MGVILRKVRSSTKAARPILEESQAHFGEVEYEEPLPGDIGTDAKAVVHREEDALGGWQRDPERGGRVGRGQPSRPGSSEVEGLVLQGDEDPFPPTLLRLPSPPEKQDPTEAESYRDRKGDRARFGYRHDQHGNATDGEERPEDAPDETSRRKAWVRPMERCVSALGERPVTGRAHWPLEGRVAGRVHRPLERARPRPRGAASWTHPGLTPDQPVDQAADPVSHEGGAHEERGVLGSAEVGHAVAPVPAGAAGPNWGGDVDVHGGHEGSYVLGGTRDSRRGPCCCLGRASNFSFRPLMRVQTPWKLATLVAIGFALFVPAAAEAQTIASPYRFIQGRHDVGMIVGVVQENRGSLGIAPGGGLMFGARYAIEISGPFAAELTGFLLPTERTVFTPQDNVGIVAFGEASVTLAAIDARIRFTLTGDRTWRGLAPFAMAGGGVVGSFGNLSSFDLDLIPANRVDFGPSLLFVGGAGTRWIPGDRLTVRAEATYHFWRQGTPPGWVTVEEELEGQLGEEWLAVPGFVIGVSYRR